MKRLSDYRGDNFSGGRITELSLYKGDTYKLELEGGTTFFLNCALVADYDLYEGGEMDSELLEKLQRAGPICARRKSARCTCMAAACTATASFTRNCSPPTGRRLPGPAAGRNAGVRLHRR